MTPPSRRRGDGFRGLPKRAPAARATSDGPPATAVSSVALPAPPAGAPVWHALIASANPDATADLAFTLARLAIAVATVRDGDELDAAVQRRPPHLTFASLALPRLAGLSLLRRLRTTPESRHAGLVVLLEPADALPADAPALTQGIDGTVRYPDEIPGLPALTARVAAAVAARWPRGATCWAVGPVAGDDVAMTVHAGGVALLLTNRERAVLRALARHPDGLSDHDLQVAVWGAPQRPGFRGHIAELSRLRQKLAPVGLAIERTPGQGYRVRVDGAP